MVDLLIFISIAIACTTGTSWLIRKKNFPAVRASSLLTVFVVSVVMLIDMNFGNRIAPVVLGATFVGMSDAEKLRKKSLLFASVVFSLVFFYVIPLNPGFGGALGLAAFCSCVLVYSMKSFLSKKRN